MTTIQNSRKQRRCWVKECCTDLGIFNAGCIPHEQNMTFSNLKPLTDGSIPMPRPTKWHRVCSGKSEGSSPKSCTPANITMSGRNPNFSPAIPSLGLPRGEKALQSPPIRRLRLWWYIELTLGQRNGTEFALRKERAIPRAARQPTLLWTLNVNRHNGRKLQPRPIVLSVFESRNWQVK